MSTILEVQNLVKEYDSSGFRLNSVTFSIPGGTIMGFVGENGAGKTTTIGCILNTLIKDSGTVRIFGREMTDDSTDSRDQIGVVYDSNAFPEHLTAQKISSSMQHIYSDWDDALFLEYLGKFKLPCRKKIKTFSRGMTMKLAVAVALSHRPRLLILDEATSGLDPIVRDEILEVFLGFVRDSGNSILLSSHITSDLEKVADHITFIHDGSIVLTEKKSVVKEDYGVVRCSADQLTQIDACDVRAQRRRDHHVEVLVADRKAAAAKYQDVMIDSIAIEEIMLMLVKGEQ